MKHKRKPIRNRKEVLLLADVEHQRNYFLPTVENVIQSLSVLYLKSTFSQLLNLRAFLHSNTFHKEPLFLISNVILSFAYLVETDYMHCSL